MKICTSNAPTTSCRRALAPARWVRGAAVLRDGLVPRARASCLGRARMLRGTRLFQQPSKQQQSVLRGVEGLDGVFGMRHEREDASGCIADACDVVRRAVRVVVVAEEDLSVLLQRVEGLLRRVVSSFAVRDGNAERCVFCGLVGEMEAQVLPCADESSRCVSCERSGQEVGFGENLESVADSYDQRSFFCLLFECGDDRLTSGERAGSEVVSPSEAAG